MLTVEDVNEHGGILDIRGMTRPARSVLSRFRRISSRHIKHICKTYGTIELLWLNSHKFFAIAGNMSDRPCVAVSFGTPLVIQEAFDAILSHPDSFVDADKETKELPWALPVPDRLGLWTCLNNRMFRRPSPLYWRTPVSEIRRGLSQYLAEIGFLFVLYHEISHLLRRHPEAARKPFLCDGPQTRVDLKDRMFEIDADWYGSSLLARVGYALDYRKGRGNSINRGLGLTFLFAVGITLSLLDPLEDPDIAFARFDELSHAHPLYRFFVAVDAGGAGLRESFGLKIHQVQTERERAFHLLMHFSSLLNRPRGVWHTPDKNRWDLAMEQYLTERMRYLAWERDMTHSGILSSLPGGITQVASERRQLRSSEDVLPPE